MELIKREMTSAELAQMYRGFEAHSAEKGNLPVEDKRLTFVAVENGEFIGCSSGLINENGRWFLLTDLFVEKPFRRTGLGSQLLAKIEAQAKADGVEESWTRTAGYEAVSFYEKQGYTVFFELENWYQSGHGQFGLRKTL